MMKKHLEYTIGDKLDLPAEAISNTPYVELRGNRSVSIENHRGILVYDGEEIKINVKRGVICVQGSNLTIGGMNRRRIEVRGNIRSIVLV